MCNDVKCTNVEHVAAIDGMYVSIIDALDQASASLCQPAKKEYKQVPLWNEICAEHHTAAREGFLMWRANNCPKSGPIFEIMRKTRAQFKLVFKQCKATDKAADSNRLAKKLLHCNEQDFWKEVKKMNCRHSGSHLAETVDGFCGAEAIVGMWQDHFSSLLNSNSGSDNIELDCQDEYLDRFSHSDVEEAIKTLKSGKASGCDGLSGEHFKYAHTKINVLLSLVINCMICHNFLPESLMKTAIVPIIKDKKGDLSCKDNYRPVAITSVVSKVFEKMILTRYMNVLGTSCNQFGFKPAHSTDMCIFVMKQVIEFYTSHGSPVYMCFLDASKAFDRTNHVILFKRLIDRKVPLLVVRIIQKWYASQLFFVRWGDSISGHFTVTNGVRQGVILSPYLFNVFTDELSRRLMQMNIGCTINGVNTSHLLYADDTVILAPSPSALQKLIDECEIFANECQLVFNPKKTKAMCIKPDNGKLKNVFVPDFYLNNTKITSESNKYVIPK